MAEAPPPESDARALWQSFAMIIASEIGDKTFLIAAILAFRHPRLVVFAGAFGSLVAMSILSATLGHLLPTLIPKRYTQLAAAVLFLVFGVKMLWEGKEMEGGSERMEEEMKEVQQEIDEEDAAHGADPAQQPPVPLDELEEGGRKRRTASPANDDDANGAGPSRPPPPHRRSSSMSSQTGGASSTLKDGARNFCSLFFGPVFVQAFILTFLGEWGDRSQIATIALAAAHNLYVVALGTIIGHGCCTALAVIAGKYVSTKISIKQVTLGGGALFILFAFIYFYEIWATWNEAPTPLVPVHPGE